jgi:GntR family transcriptional regulator, transcriptional repressor for pyruvate dehydrogenase complex
MGVVAGKRDESRLREKPQQIADELRAMIVSGEAEEHWRAHMAVVGRVMLGQQASTVVELLHH